MMYRLAVFALAGPFALSIASGPAVAAQSPANPNASILKNAPKVPLKLPPRLSLPKIPAVGQSKELRIVSGPTVSEIAQRSVVVTWQTSIPGTGSASWDHRAGVFGQSAGHKTLLTEHRVVLDKLSPATVYHVQVESKAGTQKCESSDVLFVTRTAPPATRPAVSTKFPKVLRGTALIGAAFGNVELDRVVFSLDGKPAFTDYSFPFEWPMDTRRLPDSPHVFGIRAIDVTGNAADEAVRGTIANRAAPELSPVRVRVLHPDASSEVRNRISIEARIDHDLGSHISDVEFLLDEVVIARRHYLTPRRIGRGERTIDMGGGTPPLCEVAYADTAAMAVGSLHEIRVRASDGVNWGDASIAVRIAAPPPPAPAVSCNRFITRRGNSFEVALVCRNTGNCTLNSVVVTDSVSGFQIIKAASKIAPLPDGSEPPLPIRDVSVRTERDASIGRIRMPVGDIGVGKLFTLKYEVVPVLSELPLGSIGPCEVLCTAAGADRTLAAEGDSGWSSSLEIDEAVRSADYIIATNPRNLFRNEPRAAGTIDDLLCAMAELAAVEDGVIGYIRTPGSFWGAFSRYDAVAVGNIVGDSRDEVVIARDDTHQFCAYDSAGQTVGFGVPDFTQYDGLAIADMNGDGTGEVVVARDDDHRLTFYDPYGAALGSWDIEYTAYDGFAAGDIDGDGDPEIVVIKDGESVARIYDHSGSLGRSFPCAFSTYDDVSVANVNTDRSAEIITASVSDGLVRVYDRFGAVLSSFDADYTQRDAMTVSDLDTGAAEILIARAGGGGVDVYSVLDPSGRMTTGRKIATLDCDYTANDLLQVGRIDHDSNPELVIPSDDYGMVNVYKLVKFGGALAVENMMGLRDLLGREGDWSLRMADDFTRDGYLLIVGETPIVPTCQVTYNGNGVGETETVRATDLVYADAGGEVAHPELCVGRIIGDTASDLILPIRARLEDIRATGAARFDFGSALIYTGYQGDDAGKIIYFYHTGHDVEHELVSKGFTSCYWIHSRGWVDPVLVSAHIDDYHPSDPAAAFRASSQRKDVIYIAGHGSPFSDDSLHVDTIDRDGVKWTDPHPVVICAGCLTGRYVQGLGFAEACLKKGAGAYIGATEVAYNPPNHRYFERFFEQWDEGEAIGKALKDQKRDIYCWSPGHYWCAIANLYGDPKYGMR